MSRKATNLSAGNVSRPTAGLLASGAYSALVGAVFMFPLTLNSGFAGSHESISNFIFGALIFLIGSTLLIASLSGLGLSRGITILFAAVNPLPFPLLCRLLAYLNLLVSLN